MATLCRNCGNPLYYDPVSRRVICDACGSAFAAESVEAYGKELEENTGAVKEFLECHVYACSSCGGEIVVNGSEASATCIYCGSPSVIFSRISKERRPDFILPFQISKEQATDIIRARFKGGLFIPKEFKNLQPDSVRGIYIPYWLVDVYHAESNILCMKPNGSNSSSMNYYARAGHMKMNNLPIEASLQLNDSSSQRLEPYDLRKLKHFDEEYMLGFYSNMSDMTFGDLRKTVDARAETIFKWNMRFKIPSGSGRHITDSQSATLIDKDLKYALLPAWFVTVQYEGKPHTILVNGENGKVVCGLPWNKKLFWSLVGIVTASVGGFFALISGIITAILSMGPGGSLNTLMTIPTFLPLALPWLLFSSIFFLIGLIKYKKVTEQTKLTQDVDIFNFAKKRQG